MIGYKVGISYRERTDSKHMWYPCIMEVEPTEDAVIIVPNNPLYPTQQRTNKLKVNIIAVSKYYVFKFPWGLLTDKNYIDKYNHETLAVTEAYSMFECYRHLVGLPHGKHIKKILKPLYKTDQIAETPLGSITLDESIACGMGLHYFTSLQQAMFYTQSMDILKILTHLNEHELKE